MQGYVRVSPAGSNVKLMANVSKKAQAQLARQREGRSGKCMSKLSRLLLALASALVLAALATPLWRIQLIAPQYPEGLGMEIHAGTVRGATEHDLQSINSLNHYIGMKAIEPEEIAELRVMPWLIAGLAVAGFVAAGDRPASGRRSSWLASFGAPRRGRPVGLLSLGIRVRPRPRSRARDHQGAGNDVPAAAHRVEATVELHGELVAGDRAASRSGSRSCSASRRSSSRRERATRSDGGMTGARVLRFS